MSKDDNGNGKKRPLSRAEKFKNYCLGIAALSALILGIWTKLEGEPEAEKANVKADEAVAKAVKAYETVTKQMNEVVKAQRKLHLRMVHIQAHDEGYRAAKMMLQLQEENDKLRKAVPRWKQKKLGVGGSTVDPLDAMIGAAGPIPSKVVKAQPKPARKKCRDGYVEAEGRCQRVSRAVAKTIKRAKEELLAAKRKAALEAKRRELLIKKMKAQQDVDIPKPLPPKLDDASKPGK